MILNNKKFCKRLYISDHLDKIPKEIESHLVPKLWLRVRMWSRRLSLLTVATTILRFLPTIWSELCTVTVATAQSIDHSFFDQLIPSWSWPNKHQVSLIISFVKEAPTWWVDSLQWERPPLALQRVFSTSLDKTRPDPLWCSPPPGVEQRRNEKISINFRLF